LWLEDAVAKTEVVEIPWEHGPPSCKRMTLGSFGDTHLNF
jgi:hypothetical protein